MGPEPKSSKYSKYNVFYQSNQKTVFSASYNKLSHCFMLLSGSFILLQSSFALAGAPAFCMASVRIDRQQFHKDFLSVYSDVYQVANPPKSNVPDVQASNDFKSFFNYHYSQYKINGFFDWNLAPTCMLNSGSAREDSIKGAEAQVDVDVEKILFTPQHTSWHATSRQEKGRSIYCRVWVVDGGLIRKKYVTKVFHSSQDFDSIRSQWRTFVSKKATSAKWVTSSQQTEATCLTWDEPDTVEATHESEVYDAGDAQVNELVWTPGGQADKRNISKK